MVDGSYIGQTMPLQDQAGGTTRHAQVFVGSLSASQRLLAFLLDSMRYLSSETRVSRPSKKSDQVQGERPVGSFLLRDRCQDQTD
jgi:hypothetical protein